MGRVLFDKKTVKPYVSLIGLAVSLLLSIAISIGLNQAILQFQHERFEHLVNGLNADFYSKLDSCAFTLKSVHVCVDSQGVPDHDRWTVLVNTLNIKKHLPGAEGIAVMRTFTEDERHAIVAAEIEPGSPFSAIHPPGIRKEYTVIFRIAPWLEDMKQRIGYDITAEAMEHKELVRRARDSGTFQCSCPLFLAGDSKKEGPAFLMIQPVYYGGGVPATVEDRRAKHLGFVSISLRFKGMVAAVMQDRVNVIDLKMEIPGLSGKTFSISSGNYGEYHLTAFTSMRTISLGGQEWALTYRAKPSFVTPLERLAPWALLAAGTLISIFTYLFLRTLQRIGLHAEERAKEMSLSYSNALQQMQNLLDAATEVAIVATNMDGIIRVFNRGAEKILGWSAQEVIGIETPALWDENLERDLEEVGAYGRIHRSKDMSALTHGILYEKSLVRRTCITKSGKSRIIGLTLVKVDEIPGGEEGQLAIFIDLTREEEAEKELHRHEELLRQSQKMEAIGQLAGGVAHDFNNMLAGIMGAAELLSLQLPKEDKRQKLVSIIADTSSKAGTLTGKLLSFSRKSKVVSTPLDLHSVIDETLLLLQRSIEKNIYIQIELKAGLTQIIGDPVELGSALLNLCVNARDAMPDGGTLSIMTETVHITTPFIDSLGRKVEADEYILLKVSDTGSGISKEVQKQVFEPFFTTKEEGRGTGLGLAAVYGTVKNHHGFLTLESEIGRGTLFSLYFPLDESRFHPQTLLKAEEELEVRGGTILVIDDEELVRNTTTLMLKETGYDVISAHDGQSGLDLMHENLGAVKLVLLDLVMPGLSSKEVLKRLKSMKPDVKVIAVSGFSQKHSSADTTMGELDGFLQKPYSLKELRDAVASILASTI